MSTPPASRIIYQDANRLVRLEVIYRPGANEHNHPVTISSRNMATILTELTVSPRPVRPQRGPFGYEKGGEIGENLQIFSEDNVHFLSQQVAKALERATPAEDVMFFLKHSQSGEPSEFTSGSVFVEGKQIHILFANYRHRTVGNIEIQKAQANPLEVFGTSFYDLTPGLFGKVENAKSLKTFVIGAPQHLVIDYLSLLKTHGMAKDENSVSPPNRSSANQSTADKLQELDEMRQKHLISEEEFQNLRSKLLNSF